jgi:hypothetical protein
VNTYFQEKLSPLTSGYPSEPLWSDCLLDPSLLPVVSIRNLAYFGRGTKVGRDWQAAKAAKSEGS